MTEFSEHARDDREATVLPFPKMPTPENHDQRSEDLRSVLGDVLREERKQQERTLAEVAADAAVSVAYLSEVERGRKDISSELLDAVTGALELPLATALERCVKRLDARAKGNVSFQLCAA